MEQFIQLRQKCINEGSVECDTCEWYKEDSLSHASQPHLAYVSVNLYPAPCNGSCIYCNKKSLLNRPIDKIVYERVLDSLQYAIEKAWITKDTRWQISSGEITVHPYKKEILGLIKNSPCSIFTNAIIYDEDIAKILSQNNRASIFVSIDAGTRDTFQKVKRANNFEVVVNNLRRYKEQCLEAEQIMLKYIVLPGVNDATADHEGMIKIMKELEITDLTIAHEAMEKVYGVDTKTKTAAAHLLALLMKNNFTHNTYFPYFFPSVMKEVEELAKELIEKEKLYATSTPPNTLTCLT
jgi:wyosine [tRNA(Phe)-imidazoG37] synthetase (radical SAM superfamily)